jgi:hypothetical protein
MYNAEIAERKLYYMDKLVCYFWFSDFNIYEELHDLYTLTSFVSTVNSRRLRQWFGHDWSGRDKENACGILLNEFLVKRLED